MEVKPVGDMVALQLLDKVSSEIGAVDDAGDAYQAPVSTSASDYNRLLLAQVVGVGDGKVIKERKVKKGQVVFIHAYAAEGPKVGDDTVLGDVYCIVAFVTGQ